MNPLDRPLSTLPGIGPKTAAALAKFGLDTLRDLLYYFPRDYEDYQSARKIADLIPGRVMVQGKIRNITSRPGKRRGITITEAEVYDDTGAVRVVWFNQPYRAKAMNEKRTYTFAGEYGFKYNRYQLSSPTVTPVADTKIVASSDYQPVYVSKGIYKSAWFKRLLLKTQPVLPYIPDIIPIIPHLPDFVKPGTRRDALYNIHFPDSAADSELARRYLSFEELFEIILAAQLNKHNNTKLSATPLRFEASHTKELVSSLPFSLTNAQRRAAWDILKDLEKPVPMNRLLQGDVGSGKTVVAAISLYQAYTNHTQSALLAPTAILATQHYEGLKKLLEPLGVRLALLISATKNKPELKAKIASGQIDVIIGTHAVLTDDTKFQNLSFCVIDEQHRFGVNQRAKLLSKTEASKSPHLLAMTATPIPRSLQLTLFGDLAVSIIDELPKGRQQIHTEILNDLNMRDSLYPHIKEALESGEQVYWICKLIEESSRSEAIDVKKQTEKLKKIFPGARIDFLHGRMKPDEKDQKMTLFSNHEIDILVSTTVVEVGVDVPNATQIVIMDAENYGLAQLHQLRGRVGRGSKASSCYLIRTGEGSPSTRLRELKKSTDGFHLAEVDLKLRGPGEIYGQLQHGALNLRIANIADTKLIAQAAAAVREFMKHPEDLSKYPELQTTVQKYQQLTTLN